MNRFTRYLILLGMVLMAAGCCPFIGKIDHPKVGLTPGQPQLRGVNLTGGDVAYGMSNTTSPVSGTDYLFVSHQDIDYLASKGVRFVRLVFSWEITQPTLNSPLATTGNTGVYMSTFVDRVNYLTSKDIHVLVEPHGASDTNFVRYKGSLVGSAAVPNSAFADFWARMATQFKANPRVMYGLSNEPHDMSTMQWYAGAQAAIDGIRSTGVTSPIFVAGNGWSQPSSWNDNWYDTASTKVSNATGWATLKDPSNNLVVSVHTYFDANSGGGADDIAGADIIQQRLAPVVAWARARGLKVHLSELGATASATGAQTAVTNALNYMDANTDVILGWSWWAYGPPAWWGGYRFTLDPKTPYTVDDPKMAWLSPFFVPSVQPNTSVAQTPVTCVFTYSSWSACQSNGTQTRTATSSPVGCTGTPILTQACTYTPPTSVMPLVVTSTKTYDWGSGYCRQYYFKNNNAVPVTWKTMKIYLGDGKLRGTAGVWGAVFTDPTATGTIVVTPTPYTATVKPGQNLGTVGFCVDYGPTKYAARSGGLTY